VQVYQFLKRQILAETANDQDRETLVRAKVIEATKDSFNFNDDIIAIRKRIYSTSEQAKEESKQLKEDVEKQVSILRRKFIEEENRTSKLQGEVAELSNQLQELNGRLSYSDNALAIEKSQSALLYEKIFLIEKELKQAALAVANSMDAISGLRRPSLADNSTQPHQHVAVEKQITDAESVINNLNKMMKQSEDIRSPLAYAALSGSGTNNGSIDGGYYTKQQPTQYETQEEVQAGNEEFNEEEVGDYGQEEQNQEGEEIDQEEITEENEQEVDQANGQFEHDNCLDETVIHMPQNGKHNEDNDELTF